MMPMCVGLLLNYRDSARSISCIKSLIEQGVDAVVVWDNSADGGTSATIIQEVFVGSASVSIELSSENIGFGAGVNRGLEVCRQRFGDCNVLLINNDAILLPYAIVTLEAALANNPGAGICFPSIRQGPTVHGAMYYHYWTGLLFTKPHRGCFAYASGCCMLIALMRVGLPLFDETFFMYGEDCELSWRLGRKPGVLRHVDEVLVDHEGAASSGLGSPFYEEHMVASHLVLVYKLAGTHVLRRSLLLVSRLLMLFARALLRSYRFRSFVPLRSLIIGRRIAIERLKAV